MMDDNWMLVVKRTDFKEKVFLMVHDFNSSYYCYMIAETAPWRRDQQNSTYDSGTWIGGKS
jgi:hypothetical protein